MPDYMTLAYEGNYAGRCGDHEWFTYKGNLYVTHPYFITIENPIHAALVFAS